MASDKTVFIKRDGSFYAIDYEDFKYDKTSDSYKFFIPLDKDNSISESIDALDFKFLKNLSLEDLEKLITFSDPDIVYELCYPDITGSFVVDTDGLTVDKQMLKRTAKNILNAEFSSDLFLFYSYLFMVLIDNDIIKYKKINLPRFIIPIKSVLSSLSYLIRTYAVSEDSKRLDLFIETVEALPDDLNPKLESLITNETEEMKYAVEVIKSKVNLDSLTLEEKLTFINCLETSMKYYCQPVIEYCAYGRAYGNELFDRDVDLAIKYFRKLIDEVSQLHEYELFSEYCYEVGSLFLEKSEDDKSLIQIADEYFKMSALCGNSKAKIALYDLFTKKKSKSQAHVFVANQMLFDATKEGIERISLSEDVKQLPEAMIRKGIQYFEYACEADTEEDEEIRLSRALENYLIGYRAQIEREKQYPDRKENAIEKIYFLKCIDDSYGDSNYDLRKRDTSITMQELNEILDINKTGNDVYFRLSLDSDSKGSVKGSIKMFRKSDHKPLRMCICIPQCWYCDFVSSFEFQEDVIESTILDEDGNCDFDVIIGNDLYLNGGFMGSFDGTIKFIANDYIDFENEIEQLRKDSDANDIFEGYIRMPEPIRYLNS